MSNLQPRRSDVFSLFDDFLGDLWSRNVGASPQVQSGSVPAVARARMDVTDQGERFEVKVDLPGVKRDDIHVTIEGPRVSISAQAKSESESKDKEGRVLHSERYAARYARSFELPVEVDDKSAKARFEDGVLTLALPKKAAVVSKRLAID